MNLRFTILVVLIAAALGLGWTLYSARRANVSPPPGDTTSSSDVVDPKLAEQEPRIVAFCGNCHGFPQPDTFPRNAWYAEVERGFNFYRESGRSDLAVPVMADVVSWYRHKAPSDWVVAESTATVSRNVAFEKQSLKFPDGGLYPAVSSVQWELPGPASTGILRFCDMHGGQVQRLEFSESGLRTSAIATLRNPAHAEPCDLDQDGLQELLVAELGSFQPGDHNLGKITLLSQTSPEHAGTTETLADGLGRIADVQARDFDEDGDFDLVVAEFGWLKSGRVLYMENTPSSEHRFSFRTRVIDDRHGAIHVPVADLNNDGKMDFVALISQEFEVIEAYLNLGQQTFEKRTIYAANDPSFGSSGIQLTDLDRDGDLDVLYSNGDSLDSHYLKPYHAVHWLENTGTFPFVHHEIGRLPGASRAIAGDLDNDGDNDVIAASYLPVTLLKQATPGAYDSLVWFENLGDCQYQKHRLEHSSPGHLALEAGDFDADGDLDLAVGNHGESMEDGPREWLSIWWNQLKTPPAKSP